jgi:hypothetical protein
LARSGVTVVGAPTKSILPDCMAGMSPENSPAKISTLRPMRRPASITRSTLNPSTPPPSLGIACGAKVPSMPTTIGFCWANAVPATSAKAAAAITVFI